MIRIGLDPCEKELVVRKYVEQHNISKVVAIAPSRFKQEFGVGEEHVEWAEVTLYKFYYRLLQEIDHSTLIIINECLRTQNRHDLTYNCIRNYLNQTKHQIVFQYLPLIDQFDDFMTLLDFDTRSKWKRDKFRESMLDEVDLEVKPLFIEFAPIEVSIPDKAKEAYSKKKRKLIDEIGLKDPHTIPRNLYLVSGKYKVPRVEENLQYVGRNNRFKLPNLATYKEVGSPGSRIVFEFCHNFINFSDFLYIARQSTTEVLVSDLKVDRWYLERYQSWAKRVHHASATLRR